MASSSNAAAAEPTQGEAGASSGTPTPTSLMGLPKPWLMDLATGDHVRIYTSKERVTLLRTCKFFFDAILRRRRAWHKVQVSIAAEDFNAELDKLCTLARRSGNVALTFHGIPEHASSPTTEWTETEPHITHLLVSAQTQLGGKPLTCIKWLRVEVRARRVHTRRCRGEHSGPKVAAHQTHSSTRTRRSPYCSPCCAPGLPHFQALEMTALVPAWVKALCPGVETFFATACNITTELPPPPPSSAATPMCQHLKTLSWHAGHDMVFYEDYCAHLQHQLACLPSLTRLTMPIFFDRMEPALLHAGVTSLDTWAHAAPELLAEAIRRLPAQLPALQELRVYSVDDEALDLVLERLPHLQTLCADFELWRGHQHQAHLRWPDLEFGALNVDSLALLPLESVRSGRCKGWVEPSEDARAVARVAQALRRWPGAFAGYVRFQSSTRGALVASLRPLLEALPEGGRRRVSLQASEWLLTAEALRQLGQQLPPGVAHLGLEGSVSPSAWPEMLRSLPGCVEELSFYRPGAAPSEDEACALCAGAVRPVRVRLQQLGKDAVQRVRARLEQEFQAGAAARLVTLVTGW